MGKWMQWLEKWMGGGPGGVRRVQSFRWLIIVGLVGVAIMIINSFITVKEVEPPGDSRASPKQQQAQQTFLGKDKNDSLFEEYETKYESALKDMLEKIVGVGEAEVMVTLDTTEELVVKENEKHQQQVTNEKDQNGANRTITDITTSGEVVLHEVSGDQTPIVLKTIKPKIRGVLVVAKGVENLTVKKMVTEAVERGLDVPPHRISIVPRKH